MLDLTNLNMTHKLTYDVGFLYLWRDFVIILFNLMTQDKVYIYGRHAVAEALKRAPKALRKIFLSSPSKGGQAGADANLKELIRQSGVPTVPLASGRELRDISGSEAHQGVIGLISLKGLMRQYDEFAGGLSISPNTALVLLDEIQDPHNVGAIIRSAAAFGISGVLIPEHNQAPITSAVVKVSAGMAFSIPLVSIGNINGTVRDLKKRGFWVLGLDGNAKKSIADESFDTPTLFILGNEAKGIRQKTRELCDALVSIPIDPKCESLNVAASAAVALYAWSAKHDIIKP
ncbi:MAG: 23S rRNA (guanosine(2251)-2'-O)-methyltransferase RlmB [Candidatus Paceibacterota bacterium]